ncbi:DISARM system phospholipase D-like protein DrmC [Micromonospora sp. LOL_025]|uniref:DISARM system phospholipase D-like protein DrmC n=1 Tax=Micromonospora sp. LOL_025 TaxID=3345413 RepID=UPI003A8668F7
MDSSETSIDASAARRLGELLTGTEARQVAGRLADGDTLTVALKAIPAGRRAEVRSLMGEDPKISLIAVLRAIEGARTAPNSAVALWTMPGHVARGGPLTSSVSHFVEDARQSVTCSTFNFQRSSALWATLRRAALRPELAVRVYVDTAAADHGPSRSTPTTTEVAKHLHPGLVLRTREFNGVRVRNHAKFIAIDHRFLLVSSANFSWSAENGNVEFGILIDNRNLTEAVEREMLGAEDLLYERVVCGRGASAPRVDGLSG